MIQNLNVISQQFLSNLQTLQQQLATTQAQVSSGTKISQPSDDPGAVTDVLQLESSIGHMTQVSSNLTAVKGQVDTAESALESATQILLQAQTLGAEGANSTVSATTRSGIAQQVELVLSQLVSVSQTQFEGNYVFGGDQDTQASYQLDLTSATGVDRLVKTTSTRQIQDATGVTFADSLSAQDIFDHRDSNDAPDANNVFAAVNNLRLALANNDQVGITNAMAGLSTVSDYLNQQLAFYGRIQDRVAAATDLAQKFQLQYQTALSSKKDTDMASAAVALSQEQTSMQAAIQAQASLPRTSLFNFVNTSG
jgi:flagellar hook-associated protein 3 FlgL